MRREHPLEGLERDLKLSPRRRLELLEELDADAEALQAALEGRGYDRAQARRMTLQQLVPSGEAAAELEARHAPRVGRWARTAGWMERLERVVIVAAAIVAGAAAIGAMVLSGPFGAVPVLAWAQVVVIALLAANWTLAAKRLWIDGDLRPELRGQLWTRQIGLVVAAIALGSLGAAWQGYGAWEALDAEAFSVQSTWDAIRRIVLFAAVGFGAAIFGLFGWLALTPRLINDEMIERRIETFFAGSRFSSLSTRR